MQISVGVEYAFHTLFYMVDLPKGKTVNIRDLARFNQISETYLSKAFTKLRKTGIVRSVPGVKGGYELARSPADISFGMSSRRSKGLRIVFNALKFARTTC